MAIFRKTVLATAMLAAGLTSTAGLAMADESHGAGQEGLANVDDIQTQTPANACNNDVPVNVLGVQIPVQDVAADVPVASGSEDGHAGNGAGVDKGCENPVKSKN